MRPGDAEAPTLPPRPNLGPEPWPDAPGPSAWWWLCTLTLIIFGAWLLWQRRRMVKRDEPSPEAEAMPSARTSTERLIALAESIREAMSARLGPSWNAKTTEEIAASLADLDPTVRALALRLLDAADRAKFAGGVVDDDHFALAESWAAAAMAGLRPDEPRSIQNGR